MVHIINFGLPTAEQGSFTISVPPEYWVNPTRIETLLGMTGEDQQSGALQIEFGDKPDAILRRQRGGYNGFAWDPDQEHYRTTGVIETFEYTPARLLSMLIWAKYVP